MFLILLFVMVFLFLIFLMKKVGSNAAEILLKGETHWIFCSWCVLSLAGIIACWLDTNVIDKTLREHKQFQQKSMQRQTQIDF